MALYLGTDKLKIDSNYVKYHLNLFSEIPITNGIMLQSSEGYTLKDSKGLYITVKESE